MRKAIPKLFSLKEAAEILGISKNRLWQWINQGQFPIARRVGSLWKIPEDGLREFLNLEKTVRKRVPKKVVNLPGKKKADDSLLQNILEELVRLRKLIEGEIDKKKVR